MVHEKRFLFLLSHMRSCSTLLSQILVTNPEIAGFGECHLSYQHRDGLRSLESYLCEVPESPATEGEILFDKILHNQFELGDTLLESKQGRFLFLIRPPAHAITSMVRAYPTWFTSEKLATGSLYSKAAAYYESRLKHLLYLCCRIDSPQRTLLLTRDELLNRTDDVFRAIETWLHLKTKLSEQYLPPPTDQHYIGDPSSRIHIGYINREDTGECSQIPLSGFDRIERLYHRVFELMNHRCQRI